MHTRQNGLERFHVCVFGLLCYCVVLWGCVARVVKWGLDDFMFVLVFVVLFGVVVCCVARCGVACVLKGLYDDFMYIFGGCGCVVLSYVVW